VGEDPGLRDVPVAGRDVGDALADLAEVLGDGVATTSGRYLGYIPGGGLPVAAVADYVAAGMNPYAALSSISPGAAAVETAVVEWLCQVVGLPVTAGGVLTSGGSTAALTAVVAARDSHRVLERDPRDAVVYTTSQAHVSLRRALHVAGCAAVRTRVVPTDDRHRMRPDALAEGVREDLAAGRRPWLVTATAGTTNTGAVDPLAAIADIAAANNLWLHVDGAYGGLFTLSPIARPELAGLHRADSVILDPHKTLFLPYGVGAVLVADRQRLTDSFATAAEYLPDGTDVDPADLGVELTRPFRGLRVWLALQSAGREAFEAALTEKALLARLAHERLSAVEGLQVGPAPQLSVFVFRVSDALGGDAATARLVERLRDDGTAFLSTTSLAGQLWARVAVLSFRTHLDHVTDLCEQIASAVAGARRARP
jgi:glutamate/tyrosine decarboxylase-like PLP-dependent enzyme